MKIINIFTKNTIVAVCIVIFVLLISLESSIAFSMYTNTRLVLLNKEIIAFSSSNRVIVLVDKSVYNGIKEGLSQFTEDLSKEGYLCEIYPKKIGNRGWKNPEDVKDFIISHSSNLAGCILVGNIPMPKYRVEKGYMGQPETFPCDFYYMDLDGSWEIYDEGGYYRGFYYTVFCNHTNGDGTIAPEIWVSRLSPSGWIGDKVSLLREYFERNHAYRSGTLVKGSNALIYVDDDWAKYASQYKDNMKNIYKSSCITVINNEEKTREKDYLNKIKNDKYEWIQLHAHSSTLEHFFYYSNGEKWDTLTSWELKKNYSAAIFYDLYCCEALDYFDPHCIGNLYIFGKTSGLLVMGSSKVGGMNDKGETFYRKLKDANCIGEAFKEWYTLKGVRWPEYCYGMMLFGDPTLKPKKDTNPPDVEIIEPKKGYIYIFGKEIIPISSENTIVVGSITVCARATDINGIDHVDFYVNDELMSSLKSEPYEIDLKNYAIGWYTIKVVAYDRLGNSNSDIIRLFLINL
jgi:hypothetical protein